MNMLLQSKEAREGRRATCFCFYLLLALSQVPAIAATVLPAPAIIAYQNWGGCNMSQTVTAVQQGVNVVIWFAVNLATDPKNEGRVMVIGGPDPQCVASVAAELERLRLDTVHLISIGGWDAPHPPSGFSGADLFVAWRDWNNALPRPYDGFDWDLEGNDSVESPYNTFTSETLNQMLDMSAAAKTVKTKNGGLIVTLVPAQSYFDVSTSAFNTSLLSSYSDYHPDFAYHGTNGYAYLVAAATAGVASTGETFAFDAASCILYASKSINDNILMLGSLYKLRATKMTTCDLCALQPQNCVLMFMCVFLIINA